MNGLTNATSQNIAWCPKHQIVKSVLSVRRHYPKRGRFTENLSIYLSSPAPNSLLQNSSNFGATASHWLLYILLFFFFLILNRMDAWSLMRGDAFIHFVSGSRRVNIRLEVFLLIPKSPHIHVHMFEYVWVPVCIGHLIYWSFKPIVGVLVYLSASSTCVVFVSFVVACVLLLCAASPLN